MKLYLLAYQSHKKTTNLALGMLILFFSFTSTAATIKVVTTPLELIENQLDQLWVGKLHYKGGLVISSDHYELGGLSALGISVDGKRMIALTDRGRRFAGQLLYNQSGKSH